jgi:hypothetical protein
MARREPPSDADEYGLFLCREAVEQVGAYGGGVDGAGAGEQLRAVRGEDDDAGGAPLAPDEVAGAPSPYGPTSHAVPA